MIAGLITEYLKSNRRLVLPTFGAFIKKDESGEIVFVPFLKSDDGVMKSLISSSLSVSHADAEAMLEEYLFSIKQGVAQNGRFVVENLGVVTKDANGVFAMAYDPSTSIQVASVESSDFEVVTPSGVQAASVETVAQSAAPAAQTMVTPSAPIEVAPSAPAVVEAKPEVAQAAPIINEHVIEETPAPVAQPVATPVPAAAAQPVVAPAPSPEPVAVPTPAPAPTQAPAAQPGSQPMQTPQRPADNIVDLDVPDETPVRKQTVQDHANQVDILYNTQPSRTSRPQATRAASAQPQKSSEPTRHAAQEEYDAQGQRSRQSRRARPVSRSSGKKQRPRKGSKQKIDILMIVAIAAVIAGLLVLLYGMLFPTPDAMFIG